MSEENPEPQHLPEPPNSLGGVAPDELIARGMHSVQMSGLGRGGNWQPPTLEEATRLFPDYEVLKLLGRGGMGAVYQARQVELDRFVAIKLLPLEISVNGEFADRFRKEARAMAKLNHPNIVTVYDFGKSKEGHLYFVMEYVDGANLSEVVRATRLTSQQALYLVEEICTALGYAHAKGIVHRDIKPANIMIDTESHVRVADFGLARLIDPNSEQLGQTTTHTVMGTPDYMAPEQTRDMSVDHRADIYSLGVMLYVLLCREVPKGAFLPPSQRVPGLDVRLDRIVMKAMQPEPAWRYQSTQEMKSDMRSVRKSTGSALPSFPQRTVPRMPPAAWDPRADQPHAKPPVAAAKPRVVAVPKAVAAKAPNAAPQSPAAEQQGDFAHGGVPRAAVQKPPVSVLKMESASPKRPSVFKVLAIKVWQAWRWAGRRVPSKEQFKALAAKLRRARQPICRLVPSQQQIKAAISKATSPPRAAVSRAAAILQGGVSRVVSAVRVFVAAEKWLLSATGIALCVLGFLIFYHDHFTSPGAEQRRDNVAGENPAAAHDKHGQNATTTTPLPMLVAAARISSPTPTPKPTPRREFREFPPTTQNKPAPTPTPPSTPTVAKPTEKELALFKKAELQVSEVKTSNGTGATPATGTPVPTTPVPIVTPGSSTPPPAPPTEANLASKTEMSILPAGSALTAGSADSPSSVDELHRAFTALRSPPSPIGSLRAPTSTQPSEPAGTPAKATKEHPFVNSIGMTFVPVPITDGPTDKQRVLFSIWKTRVQDYAAFVNELPYERDKPPFAQEPTHPVVMVNWEEAHHFCVWLTARERQVGKISATESYRLPTDHEWSCAVGIGGESPGLAPADKDKKIPGVYPWGNAWPPPAGAGNYSGEETANQKNWDTQKVLSGYRDDFPFTSPVGKFAVNVFGLYDLGGNAWEWCEDRWTNSDPRRTLRGASFSVATPEVMLSSARHQRSQTARADSIGFRCVLAPDAQRSSLPPPSTPVTVADLLLSPDYEWSKPENLGSGVNGKTDDYALTITADGLDLIISSTRAHARHLLECRRRKVDEPFGDAVLIKNLADSGYGSAPFLSADGLTLVYASHHDRSKSEMYETHRRNRESPWEKPARMVIPGGTFLDGGPCLSPDGLDLWFDSNRPGGSGGFDIWRAHRASLKSAFTAPVNLVGGMNSGADDLSPRVTADGRALLFFRESHGTAQRIFLTFITDGGDASAQQLDLPITGNVQSPLLSADGRTLYFASDMPGGRGEWDLWQIRRVPKAKPPDGATPNATAQ